MDKKQSKESVSGIGVADELLRKMSPNSTDTYTAIRGDVFIAIRRTAWFTGNYIQKSNNWREREYIPGSGVVITSTISIPSASLFSVESEVVRRLNRPTDTQIRSAINRIYTSALREAALVRRRMDLQVEFESETMDEAFLSAIEEEEKASRVTPVYSLMSISDIQHWSEWLSNKRSGSKSM